MELLIPGLILVALMVWASTRIKRNAAAAYDAEVIETEEFSIAKPEGFLHVLNDDSGLAFRAYSKGFGTVGNRDVRRSTIEIEALRGTDIEKRLKEISADAGSIGPVEAYIDGGEKAALVRTTAVIDGGEFDVARKLITRGDTVYEVRVTTLSEFIGEHSDEIESILDSVRVD